MCKSTFNAIALTISPEPGDMVSVSKRFSGTPVTTFVFICAIVISYSFIYKRKLTFFTYFDIVYWFWRWNCFAFCSVALIYSKLTSDILLRGHSIKFSKYSSYCYFLSIKVNLLVHEATWCFVLHHSLSIHLIFAQGSKHVLLMQALSCSQCASMLHSKIDR